MNGDINGDEATSNDLAFVFNPDDPSTPQADRRRDARVLANPRNVARDYLRANLGSDRVAKRRLCAVDGAHRPASDQGRSDDHGQWLAIGVDVFNVANLLNSNWGAEYQLPVGISNQNPVVQRLPLLNVVGFNQTTKQYIYTVNENFGVLQKAGNPYQIQLSVRYGL